MPVDKFGHTDFGFAQRTYSGGVSLSQANSMFLRQDGANVATGDIDLNSHKLVNVSDPLNSQDAATKKYVDTNAGGETRVSKIGDTMYGDLVLSAAGGNDRLLGCNDLDANRRFVIPLGTSTNRLYFIFRRNPVVMDTDHGFLVKARNELVCQFGSAYEQNEITIYKDVRMNSNRITNLSEPQLPHEVANKLYVDRTPRKILQGYVPNLRALALEKSGFVITASSQLSEYFRPGNVFSGLYSGRQGSGSEWATNGETRNFWMQIKCPDLVRLWKIALRGRDTNTQRIYRWRLEGATDGETYTTVFEPPNPTYIGDEMQYFPIESSDRFNFFRLFCIEAETRKPGLSHMQLYVYSE